MKQQITLEIVYEADFTGPDSWNWEDLVDLYGEESVKIIDAKPPEKVDIPAKRGRLSGRKQ